MLSDKSQNWLKQVPSLGFCGASQTVPNLANKVDFPTFWHEPIILRRNNTGQIRTCHLPDE